MFRRILILATFLLVVLAISACGGSSGPTAPGDDEGERVLGVVLPKAGASLIAFTRAVPDPSNVYEVNRELFLMLPNGSNQMRLTYNKADDDYAAFSPKGFALVFTSNRQSLPWGSHEVYRMNSPWNIIRLTKDAEEFDSTAADWAPGIITCAQLNTWIMAPFDVVRVQAVEPWGTWEKTIITEQIASYDPCLSRDGRYLCFCARPSGPGYFGSMELYLMDLTAGTPPVQLTHWGIDPDKPVYTRNPAFDFTGILVAFDTTFWGEDREIGYINLASAAPVAIPIRVTENKAEDVQPCWDPKGNWIAFCSNRDGNYEIYKTYVGPGMMPMPVNPVRLTKTPEDESNPDWSPVYTK